MFHVKSSRLCQPNLCFQSPNFIQQSSYHTTNNEALEFFDSLLKNCATTKHCKKLHAQVIVSGSHRSAFLASRLVSAYSQLGTVRDSQKVFDNFSLQICSSNMLLWNSIIRANVSHGLHGEALRVFDKMLKLRVFADSFTFPLVVKACSSIGSVSLCERVHGHVIQMGFRDHLHTVNELLAMYSKLGRMEKARQLFDGMSTRNHISWNIMVSGYSFNHDCDGARECFRRMKSLGFEPNHVTWTSLISSLARCRRRQDCLETFGSMRSNGVDSTAESLAVVLSVCADAAAAGLGRTVHVHLIKSGFERYSFATNALIRMYGKCNDLEDAERSFSEMGGNRNLVSSNALISSYAESGLCDEALETFNRLDSPNVISWSAAIAGLTSAGRHEEALELFRAMQRQREPTKPNRVTISGILSVCGQVAALNLGREVHGHAVKGSMERDVVVGNALVSMYARSGSLERGRAVFEGIGSKDVASWNSMIGGCGAHGRGREALEFLGRMVGSGLEPDHVTYVAALSACSHSGMVEEGREIFRRIRRPLAEHYACVVDLLSRAGMVAEAREVLRSMPVEPNTWARTAVMTACRVQRDSRAAEEEAAGAGAGAAAVGSSGSWMVLSDVYAAEGRWEEVARVRVAAREMGLKKSPGLSWVLNKDEVRVFSAGQAGPESVYRVVDELLLQMQSFGDDGVSLLCNEEEQEFV